MSNIDNIIADITEVNRTYGFYIRDEDGNLRNDIVCGEVIPFLEELKNYEIDLNDMGITSGMSELRMFVWNSNIEKYMNWTHGDYERSLLSVIREFFAYSITKEHIKLNPPIYSRKLYKMGFVAPTHLGNSYKMCNSKVKRIFNK